MANDSADVTSSKRAGDRKSSTTNSRQSAGRHYQAIGADRMYAAIVDWVGRLYNVNTAILYSYCSRRRS